ncbi:MAG: YdcF family protein [Bacteroidota bacterium]
MITIFKQGKRPHKAFAIASAVKPFDAIIVPGIPFRNGHWDAIMRARVLWSFYLFQNGFANNIIYSGSAVYTPYTEAVIMGMYAQALGIPENRILHEHKARHSTENVYFSYLLAKERGFKSLALATDPIQSFLLQGFTKKRFMSPILHIPYISSKMKEYQHLDPIIDPTSALVDNFKSITDSESISKRWGGTMGKGIDWSKHVYGKLEQL